MHSSLPLQSEPYLQLAVHLDLGFMNILRSLILTLRMGVRDRLATPRCLLKAPLPGAATTCPTETSAHSNDAKIRVTGRPGLGEQARGIGRGGT